MTYDKTHKLSNSTKNQKANLQELKVSNNFSINDTTENKKLEKSDNNINDSLNLSYIRLNKSCEVNYIRQNLDQFDIEYMCRCLGMALMKHLESSKEKNHVMELLDVKEEFSFFNSIFNKNINFLMTFFNLENKIQQISNLDKLDFNDNKDKARDDIIKSNPNQPESQENPANIHREKLPNTISYLTHIKESDGPKIHDIPDCTDVGGMNDYDKENLQNNNKKINDIENEINTIQEYFKNSTKNLKYKNVSEVTKHIMTEELNSIHEVDSVEYCRDNKLFTGELQDKQNKNNEYINLLRESVHNLFNTSGISEENPDDIEIPENNNNDLDIIEEKNLQENFDQEIFDEENLEQPNDAQNNKFSNYNLEKDHPDNLTESQHLPETPYNLNNTNIDEDIKEKDEIFESGNMESNYIIDITNADKLKNFILKTSEVYDDDYDYASAKLLHKRYVQIPDPQAIFEFCANIMILTKMEKEVIIISLVYMERFIFNTGVLINSRNWKRILFTSLIIASKIWDDDSFENNHFAQVFTHLKIGEINLLERTYLELINYKVFVKCSEYFKYFFIIKSIALKYNFNGFVLVPISVERMMKVQEYAYLAQKKLKKKYSYNNSAEF